MINLTTLLRHCLLLSLAGSYLGLNAAHIHKDHTDGIEPYYLTEELDRYGSQRESPVSVHR